MTLIDERELQSEQEKKQRIAKFIIKVIVVLLVMVFILLYLEELQRKKHLNAILIMKKKPTLQTVLCIKIIREEYI